MKTSTLIVIAASAASVLLLAVPKKGEGGSTGSAPAAPFIPKVSVAATAEEVELSEQLSAQLLRLPSLEWARDPFAPIPLAPNPLPVDPEPIVIPPPVDVPIEPVVIPPVDLPEPRTGPLPALTGISQSGAHRFAIVDRIIVREGDLLSSGDVVMSIGHRTVTLRKDEEIVVIRLGDGR